MLHPYIITTSVCSVLLCMHLHMTFTVSSAPCNEAKAWPGQNLQPRPPPPGEGARVEGSGLVLLVSSHDVLQDIVGAHGLNVYWKGTSKYG